MIEQFKDYYFRKYVEIKDIPFVWASLPPNSCEYKDDKGSYVLFDDGMKPDCCKLQLYSARIVHKYDTDDWLTLEFHTTILGRTFWSIYRDYWFSGHAGFKGISSPSPDGYDLGEMVVIVPMTKKELEDGLKKINTSPLSNLVIDIIKSEMPEFGYDDDFFYYAERYKTEPLSRCLERADEARKALKKYRDNTCTG